MDNNFYSIDRLMEFGLGMSMAQQMVRVMNDTMQSMYVPGSAATIPQPATPVSQPIYVSLGGKASGPYNEAEFGRLIENGMVNKNTLVWQPGMSSWQPVECVPSVLKIVALTPPPLPSGDNKALS